MKRLLFLIPFLLFGMVLFAQDPAPPDDIIEWVTRFPEMIGSFWGLVVSAIFLVPVLLGVFNWTEKGKVYKYGLTVFVVALLTLLAAVLDFGYLNEAKLWFIVLNGGFVMGAQVIGYAALKPLLDSIAEKFNPWKPSG